MAKKKTTLFSQLCCNELGRGDWDLSHVHTLNERVAAHFPIPESLESMVVIQRNMLRHLIPRLFIKKFARAHGRIIILFPAVHSRTKKTDDKHVLEENFLNTQDGDGNSTGPGLLYCCQGMPAAFLANQCTPLGIVNGARMVVHDVALDPDGQLVC